MKSCFLTMGICSLFIVFSFAQKGIKPKVYNVNDGLSQGMIFDIIQSRDAFLWIATKDGLNRYDGYNFKVFEPDDFNPYAIGGGEVRKLFEDSRGWIWINYLGGLDVLDPLSGRFFHLSGPGFPIFTGSESRMSPLRLAEDREGNIWLSDFDKLWRIEISKEDLSNAVKSGSAHPNFKLTNIMLPDLPQQPGKRIRAKSIFFSRKHGLLVGTSHGLYQYDTSDSSLHVKVLPNAYLSIVGEDDKGNIWLKKMVGQYASLDRTLLNDDDDLHGRYTLYTWDGKLLDSIGISTSYPNLVHIQEGKYLWTLQGGQLKRWTIGDLSHNSAPSFLFQLDQSDEITAGYRFQSFTTDGSGLVWLATNGYGIIKLNPSKPKFTSYLARQSQRAIFEDPQNNLFTQVNPLVIHPKGDFEQVTINPLASSIDVLRLKIPALFDSQGNAWGNTQSGYIFKIHSTSGELELFPLLGAGLILNKKGQFVSVGTSGLIHFDPITATITKFPFQGFQALGSLNLNIHQLYESEDGVIWIFAFEGLIKATPTEIGYTYKSYKNNPQDLNSLSSNMVLSVVDDPIDPDLFLWIGTKGGGLNRLDKKKEVFTHYKIEKGLPNNVIYGILTDNLGYLWLSTNKGLSRFHAREETVKNFSVIDGLQDNEFNTGSYFKTKDGRLIFGGINGLTAFYPDSIQYNTRPPFTRIVRYSLGQKEYHFFNDEPLFLSYKDNLLSFEFAALDFCNPEQNKYKYRLIKHTPLRKYSSDEWIDLAHKNTIQFANLAPGKYTFSVMGSNNDGFWSEDPATFNFVISAPWYASGWAYFAYILFVTVIVLLVYKYQVNRRIEQQESLRLRELDAFKNRFFTNLTHEFRTPLTVILGMAHKIKQDPKRHLEVGTQLIERNGNNLLKLINQLLDLSKLENGSLTPKMQQSDIVGYLRYLVESFQSFAELKNLSLTFSSSEFKLIMDFDLEWIKQVMINLISNAIKFTSSGGSIHVRAERIGKDLLTLEVEDTGVGIENHHIPYIFDKFYQVDNESSRTGEGSGIGLAHANELVKVMGGVIDVVSTPYIGTTFIISLPILQKASPPDDLYEKYDNNLSEVHVTITDIRRGEEAAEDNADLPLILLIEDNVDVSIYLQTILQDQYRLELAVDGDQGIQKALACIPDLIISDVMMPKKDGFEVCEALKADLKTSHIPIILLTAKTGVASRIAGLRRGADAYIAKPFDSTEFLVLVENLFQRQKRIVAYFSSKIEEPIPHEINESVLVEDAFIQKINQIIAENYSDENFGLTELCQKIGMSRSQLFRKMKAVIDQTPANFIRSFRLNQAKIMLQTTDMSVSEVAFQVGYKNLGHFSTSFQEEFRVSPSEIGK